MTRTPVTIKKETEKGTRLVFFGSTYIGHLDLKYNRFNPASEFKDTMEPLKYTSLSQVRNYVQKRI